MTAWDWAASVHVPWSSFCPTSWPEYVTTRPLAKLRARRKVTDLRGCIRCPVIVTESTALLGPTPMDSPVPVTLLPAVVRERVMPAPLGFALNSHPHLPFKSALGEVAETQAPKLNTTAAMGRKTMRIASSMRLPVFLHYSAPPNPLPASRARSGRS